MFRGRGLRPLSVCCILPLRGRGLRPPGPVAAPLVPRYALLPAPSPWVRAGPRHISLHRHAPSAKWVVLVLRVGWAPQQRGPARPRAAEQNLLSVHAGLLGAQLARFSTYPG